MRKMKILICEDNSLAMKTLSYVLKKEGYELEQAEDGREALALLQKTVYDLLIVDIHLPFRSGLELTRYVRSELKLNTPVVVLTAISDPQMQRQAGELGISGYIVKPFNPEDIIRLIRSILTGTQ